MIVNNKIFLERFFEKVQENLLSFSKISLKILFQNIFKFERSLRIIFVYLRKVLLFSKS